MRQKTQAYPAAKASIFNENTCALCWTWFSISTL